MIDLSVFFNGNLNEKSSCIFPIRYRRINAGCSNGYKIIAIDKREPIVQINSERELDNLLKLPLFNNVLLIFSRNINNLIMNNDVKDILNNKSERVINCKDMQMFQKEGANKIVTDPEYGIFNKEVNIGKMYELFFLQSKKIT